MLNINIRMCYTHNTWSVEHKQSNVLYPKETLEALNIKLIMCFDQTLKVLNIKIIMCFDQTLKVLNINHTLCLSHGGGSNCIRVFC